MALTEEGPYYVKKEQIGKDVGVRVRDIEALRADRRFSSITVHALQTFSGWMKILGTLSKEGKITLHHVDQLVG